MTELCPRGHTFVIEAPPENPIVVALIRGDHEYVVVIAAEVPMADKEHVWEIRAGRKTKKRTSNSS